MKDELTSNKLRLKIDKESNVLGTVFVCIKCKRFFLCYNKQHYVKDDIHKVYSIREIKYDWAGMINLLPSS